MQLAGNVVGDVVRGPLLVKSEVDMVVVVGFGPGPLTSLWSTAAAIVLEFVSKNVNTDNGAAIMYPVRKGAIKRHCCSAE